jgi:PST family polysaccharide transporter
MNTYGINYLVLIGREKLLKNIVLFCSIIGFAFSWLFVIKFSYIGVSITIITVWGIRGGITCYYARKIKKGIYDKIISSG